jgi:ribonucleotide monophosphatase NagD (HAD superfamily)
VTPPHGARLGACPQDLAGAYDVALLDLDGVLYLGQQEVPHAADAVRQARARGLRPAYVTNNAARSPATVAAHLTELGIPAEADDVVTSGQAAATLVAERVPPGSPVLVLGTDDLAEEVRLVGLRPVRTSRKPARRDRPPSCRASPRRPAGATWRRPASPCAQARSGWRATWT